MKQPLQLSAEKVTLLEDTMKAILQDRKAFVDAFYIALFEKHPETKPLFATVEMKEQQHKFLMELVTIVDSLRDPDTLGRTLSDLGAAHRNRYGVKPEYFPAMKTILLDTMAAQLAGSWTDAHYAVWDDAFDRIASHMLDED